MAKTKKVVVDKPHSKARLDRIDQAVKEKASSYGKEYYRKNKERIRQQQRLWQELNKRKPAGTKLDPAGKLANGKVDFFAHEQQIERRHAMVVRILKATYHRCLETLLGLSAKLQREATEQNNAKHVYTIRNKRDKIIGMMDLMYMRAEAKSMGIIEPHQAQELVNLLELTTLGMFNLVHTIKFDEKYKAGGILDYVSEADRNTFVQENSKLFVDNVDRDIFSQKFM
jgi:hypothetical protein